MTNVSDFSQWLEKEMKVRDWRQKDLIARSGISSGLLSQILSGQRTPGVETCRAIAKAFGMREIVVLEKAGLAKNEEPPKFSPIVEAMASMLNDLPEEKQEDFRALIRSQWEREQMKKSVTGKPKP